MHHSIDPKIGAMKNLRLSIHSSENIWLRTLLIEKRRALGLSQRDLAQRLGVIHSFVGKVETGDRRLDVFEFMAYCQALEMDCCDVITGFYQCFDKQRLL